MSSTTPEDPYGKKIIWVSKKGMFPGPKVQDLSKKFNWIVHTRRKKSSATSTRREALAKDAVPMDQGGERQLKLNETPKTCKQDASFLNKNCPLRVLVHVFADRRLQARLGARYLKGRIRGL